MIELGPQAYKQGNNIIGGFIVESIQLYKLE
jgi:hypothetical protein